jgi:hypothetical protein
MGDSDSNDFDGLSEEEIAAIEDDEGDASDDQNDDVHEDDQENEGAEDKDDKSSDDDKDDIDDGKNDDAESDSEDDGTDDDSKDDATKDDEEGDDKEDKKTDTDTDDTDASSSDDGKQSVDNEYEDKIKALDTKLDEGDIDFDDYKKQLLAVERERTRAIVREETSRISAEKTWESEQLDFFGEADNAKLKQNPIVYDAFAREVNRLLGLKEWKSKAGPEILAKAKDSIKAAFGIPNSKESHKKEDSDGEKAVKAAKKSSGKRTGPKTLKDVPASDKNTDDVYEYLDKLEGAEYETALSKLSEAELEAYAKA